MKNINEETVFIIKDTIVSQLTLIFLDDINNWTMSMKSCWAAKCSGVLQKIEKIKKHHEKLEEKISWKQIIRNWIKVNRQIVLALISISSCDNSARTQSKWPFITAKCNGVSYITCVVEYHKE